VAKFQPDVLYKCLRLDLEPELVGLESLIGLGIYPPGLSVQQRSALSISNSILKKYSGSVAADANDKALAKFVASNVRCSEWTLRLCTSLDEELWYGLKSAIYDFLTPEGYEIDFSPCAIVNDGSVGPGASLASRGNDFYTKLFDGPLSSTSLELYNVYSRNASQSPTWDRAEKARSSKYVGCTLRSGNRLSFVPKTTDISRVICTEPVLNMWYQMGVKRRLEDRLGSKLGIHLATQPDFNRSIARLGSNGWGFSTIDLESASDSMSLHMLRELLPTSVFRDLSKYRSPTVTLPDQTEMQLSMFSSMGNAFTFPLQTVLFSCIVCSVYRFLGIPIEKNRRLRNLFSGNGGTCHGNFGVFGDDIACRCEATRYVIRLLDICGFRVNESKSFWEGPFRESCGGDYYYGRNVRGVYIRGNEPHQLISSLNQLVEFSARTGVALPATCAYLRACSSERLNQVPRWENDDAGWKVPESYIKKSGTKSGIYAYNAWVPKSKYLTIDDSCIWIPHGYKQRCFNYDGLILSFLSGSVNSMRISVRHDRVTYRRKRRLAPNWYNTTSALIETTRSYLNSERADWKRWETAFYMCL